MTSNHLVIERFVTILILAAGLSHVLQPARWCALFADLLARPYAALVIGTLTLPLGLAIVLTHNVWLLDWAVIVTIMGWGWTIKSCLYLVAPSALNRWRDQCTGPRGERKLVRVGSVMVVVALAMTWRFFLQPVAT